MQAGSQGVQQGSPEIFREVSPESCIQGLPLQVKGTEAEGGIREGSSNAHASSRSLAASVPGLVRKGLTDPSSSSQVPCAPSVKCSTSGTQIVDIEAEQRDSKESEG